MATSSSSKKRAIGYPLTIYPDIEDETSLKEALHLFLGDIKEYKMAKITRQEQYDAYSDELVIHYTIRREI